MYATFVCLALPTCLHSPNPTLVNIHMCECAVALYLIYILSCINANSGHWKWRIITSYYCAEGSNLRAMT